MVDEIGEVDDVMIVVGCEVVEVFELLEVLFDLIVMFVDGGVMWDGDFVVVFGGDDCCSVYYCDVCV